MDPHRFDIVIRHLSGLTSRRHVLSGMVAAGLGLGAVRQPDVAARKRKRKKRKARKAQPNAFGCLDVGDPCTSADDCCSDICEGKKGKKRCRAHDTGGCPAGKSITGCGGSTAPCTTSSGVPGQCATTTGNAAYCVGGGDCRPCMKDADCQALCGPQAACTLCPVGCAGATGTQCVGPDGVVCPL